MCFFGGFVLEGGEKVHFNGDPAISETQRHKDGRQTKVAT